DVEVPLLNVSRGGGIRARKRTHHAPEGKRRVNKGRRREGRKSAVYLERGGHAGVQGRKCRVGSKPENGPAKTVASGSTRCRVGDGISSEKNQGLFQRVSDAEARLELLLVEWRREPPVTGSARPVSSKDHRASTTP